MIDVFKFLKRVSAEEEYINSLFVTAYIKSNGLVVSEDNVLSSYSVTDKCVLNSFISIVQTYG